MIIVHAPDGSERLHSPLCDTSKPLLGERMLNDMHDQLAALMQFEDTVRVSLRTWEITVC
jgi:hypothetical protein